MRDYAKEFENRVAFIRDLLKSSGAKGVIYGNSGGKDSALVGILCKAACDNTVGIMMPCASKLYHRRGRGPSRRRHRQPQRGIYGLFHEVGRRRV